MKIKKEKKSVRLRGSNSHGHGSRKKWKGKGHHGGKGMAGTGKRADQKKTLITKLYGNKYFGKQGITSKGTAREKANTINLMQIQGNLDSLSKKYMKEGILELKDYKILGKGELKISLKIKAMGFTKSAKEKIESSGGEAISNKKIRKKKEKVPIEGKKIKEKIAEENKEQEE